MPWCLTCHRFLSPATVHADGTCPTCGRPVDPGAARPGIATATASTAEADDEVIDPIPWHFKLLLGAIALYLGYRAFQGIEWIAGLL